MEHFAVDVGEIATESHFLQSLDTAERHIRTGAFVKVTTEVDFFDRTCHAGAKVEHKRLNGDFEGVGRIGESDFLQAGHTFPVLSSEGTLNASRNGYFGDRRTALEITITHRSGGRRNGVIGQRRTSLKTVTSDRHTSGGKRKGSQLSAIQKGVSAGCYHGVSHAI